MSKYVIETMCRENYAAHNGFTGEFAWKNKPGSTYIVETTSKDDLLEVCQLIEDEPNDVHYEYITNQFTADDDFESEMSKWQKEYDPEGWDTRYLDNVVRKGKNGHWYMKRGYIAGNFNKDRPEFAHLAGKECAWVDNLNTGKCVLKIEDGVKTKVEKEAA